MTRRLIAITAWLALGHAALFGLFWSLLQVPESNAAMLAVSALLVVAMIAAAGWVEATALTAWSSGASWRDALRRALPAPLAAALGFVVFAAIWVLAARAGTAWSSHSGEIDAWLMRHLGWTRTAGIHAAIPRVLNLVRFVGGLVALTLVAWTLTGGFRALAKAGGWLKAALAPKRVALAALLFYGLVWLPGKAALWRPAWLTPDWQEPAFVAVKLVALYLAANLGWAAILYLIQQGADNGKLKP